MMDTSIEDYHKDGIVTVNENASSANIKNEGTMPDSPTASDVATSKEGGNDSTSKCNYKAMAICVFVLLLLVATGLGLGLALGGDSILSRDKSLALGLDGQTETGLSPGVAPVTAPETDAPSTPFPSDMPSMMPSMFPSDAPSGIPSEMPSSVPTLAPSSFPTMSPTVSPTAPPTSAFYPVNREPDNPPRGYFNYDPNSRYGPRNWNRVDTSGHWLREFSSNGFGTWAGFSNEDLTRNVCDGHERKQSPKDMKGTISCDAEHEIRTECAQVPVSDPEHVEKLILPHKLSLQFKRRPCRNVNQNSCLETRPPMADYPRYASGPTTVEAYSDMHHFDIKVPSEHTIQGERFDAEIQMFHTSLAPSQRISSIGAVIRADDGFDNPDFQTVLNEFQRVFDLHALQCTRRRLQVREDGPVDNSTLTYVDDAIHNLTTTRQWQRLPNFNPYSDNFLTTMFFYRYDGSITEPPCRDITWWVMEQPMRISRRQLEQTKRLLFAHVDENCRPTSVHNADQSVARSIFGLSGRDIQHCEPGDFRSDVSKGRPPAKRCRGFE